MAPSIVKVLYSNRLNGDIHLAGVQTITSSFRHKKIASLLFKGKR
ncbi:hypothetical protein CHCC20345_0001 [Bacillus licheniformis]|nr:hypothetical protein CHCC20345_0001 [Bacillus licheniformis]